MALPTCSSSIQSYGAQEELVQPTLDPNFLSSCFSQLYTYWSRNEISPVGVGHSFYTWLEGGE